MAPNDFFNGLLGSHGMLSDKATSRAIELAIAQCHIEYTAACVGAIEGAGHLALSSGAACFSGVESPLSQVVGWGFDEEHDRLDPSLAAMETFYAERGATSCPVELSPYAGAELPAALAARGYRVSEVSSIAAFDLSQRPAFDAPGEPTTVRRVGEEEFALWARVTAQGFGATSIVAIFERYVRARNVFAFLAERDGEPCGAAAVAIHAGVCNLGMTSVLPAARGHGVQRQLLRRRLEFARRRGAHLASVTTEPGSISDRNTQSVGFKVVYTRIKLEKEL